MNYVIAYSDLFSLNTCLKKQQLHANHLLETEQVKDYHRITDEGDIEAINEDSLEKLGYFLRLEDLPSFVILT